MSNKCALVSRFFARISPSCFQVEVSEGADEQERAAGELARLDEVDDDATCLRVVSVNDTRVIKPLDRGHMWLQCE